MRAKHDVVAADEHDHREQTIGQHLRGEGVPLDEVALVAEVFGRTGEEVHVVDERDDRVAVIVGQTAENVRQYAGDRLPKPRGRAFTDDSQKTRVSRISTV